MDSSVSLAVAGFLEVFGEILDRESTVKKSPLGL